MSSTITKRNTTPNTLNNIIAENRVVARKPRDAAYSTWNFWRILLKQISASSPPDSENRRLIFV